MTLNNMANLKIKYNKDDEAEKDYKKAMDIYIGTVVKLVKII